MSSQMKEEEKTERIIRWLLKQPDNRRCINCNSLGPQYVCTTFWTFVCTNCSGIHREFTHRVKSVSMAKFTADEVTSLQAGGNERARQIYFKTWDPDRNFCPDGSNLKKLRDFIKQVYVDRRFTGDRIQDNKLSTLKLGPKDVYDDRRSFERSTPNAREAFSDRHSFESSSLAERRLHEKLGRGGREDLSDRCSLEKYIAARKSDEKRLRYCMDQLRSPRYTPDHSRQKNNRPAKFEIVDDRFREDGSGNVVKKYEHYRFSKTETKRGSRSPPRSRQGIKNEQSSPVVSDNAEKNGDCTKSSSPRVDAKQNHNEVKLLSLIDFDADPQPEPSNNNSETNSSAQNKASDFDSIEYLLFGEPTTAPVVDNGTTEMLALPSTEDSEVAVEAQSEQNLQSLQIQTSEFPSIINDSVPQQSTALVLYNQDSASESSQLESTPAQDDSNSSGRKELPAELFTSSYAPFSAAAASGWQYNSPYQMSYGVQYHNPNATMMVSAKSRNPFDFSDDDEPQVQAPMFPSILQLQGTPNISPSPPFQLQPLPYTLASPQLPNSYGMIMPAGAYVGQQFANNMLITGAQGSNGSETEESSFASWNPQHQFSGGIASYPSSTSRNPFS